MRRVPIVGIAGVGLIGASIGLRAAACGWHTLGWDPNLEHARTARDRGAVGTVIATYQELVAQSETLVLAAPLDATLALLEVLATGPAPNATLVLDVGSVKAAVAQAGARLGVFVPTHPIAGSERSGPLAASPDLFVDRTWMYDPAAPADAVARARAFILAMGARPYALGSVEHDRIVALTSHLPQLVSVALGARLGPELDDPSVVALCGTGIRSMLRLGASSWPVWQAIVAANRDSLAQEVRTLAGVLSMVADALDDERPDILAKDFATSAGAVARLGGTGSETNCVEATTPIDERQTWIDASHWAPPP